MSGALTIAAGTMAGSVGPKLPVAGISIYSSNVAPAQAQAQLRMNANGNYEEQKNAGSFNVLGAWVQPAVTANLYETQVVPVSGTLSSGNVNTWEAMTSSRNYVVNRTTAGNKTFTGTLQIRRASTSLVLTSCSLSLSVDD